MTEGMPTPADSMPARRAQFLATEHWSLLATRSLSWNESFSRSSMFLTSLSTATETPPDVPGQAWVVSPRAAQRGSSPAPIV